MKRLFRLFTKTIAFLALPFLFSLNLSSCSCCLYFNHWYNAQEAYDEALRLRLARLDSIPGDTTLASDLEKVQYRRVIEKCSRILERWPNEEEYKPKALFYMAESHQRIGEWQRAIRKYDEYLRYFPDGAFAPDAEYERAEVLYRAAQNQQARFALEPVLSDTAHKRHVDGLVLLAKLDQQMGRYGEAISSLEKMLASPGGAPYLRAQMKLRLARLYANAERHAEAIPFFLAPDLSMLAPPQPWEAKFEGARSMVQVEQFQEAADLLRTLVADSSYADRKIKAEMALASVLLNLTPPDEGLKLLFQLIDKNPKSAIAAEAWYRIGQHSELKLNNYDRAIADYDSAASQPACEWERKARERRALLQRIATQRAIALDTSSAVNWEEEFQIAELFFFQLDQTDSALTRLQTLSRDTVVDPNIRQRAAYANAFITGVIVGDTAQAKELWEKLIEEWPSTPYAQQAQRNLGLPVTVMTAEDSAHAAFLSAESLLVEEENPALLDSLREGAVTKFLLIDSIWPATETAAQAIYTAARLEALRGNSENARQLYIRLTKERTGTPLATDAAKRLSGYLSITETMLKGEENLLKSMREVDTKTPDYNKKFEEYKKEKERQQKEEEELLWDYEEMYNFEE